jgi:uncharacterized lipoprotein YajG
VRKINDVILIVLLASTLLAACASVSPTAIATSIPTVASTADPCSPDHLQLNAGRVHQLTRAFDDAYQLASSTPRSQLADQVARLQDIRRAAQDQAVPVCLVQLKKLQLTLMDDGVNTMLTFLQGKDSTTINQGVALVKKDHDAYNVELGQLLGATVVPPTAETPGTQVPTP